MRAAVVGLTVGAFSLGAAWAGASLVPPPVGDPVEDLADAADELTDGGPRPSADRQRSEGTSDAPATVVNGERLDDGWFLAGAAVRSIVPPEDRWLQGSECANQAPEQLYTPLTPDGCLITFDMRWADGVDDENPIEVRATAIGNGEETVVLAVMDVVGYMAAYPADVCDACGIDHIAQRLEGDLGIPAENIVVASTHTHAAPTTIADGPAWYYEFVRDQVMDAVTAAVSEMEPVRLETGTVPAKPFNTDRRIVNRAIPDYELGWLRAYVPGEDHPSPRHGSEDRTVALIGNFAVHPTVRTSNAELHSGLVGPFTQRLEEQLGGTALFFPGGLGDQRVDRGFGIHGLGYGLADLILEDIDAGGYVLETNDVAVARTTVQLPVENKFFHGALAVGYVSREIAPPYGGGPVLVAAENSGAQRPICTASAELHVVGPVSAIRLGREGHPGKPVDDGVPTPDRGDSVVLVQAPGEIFSAIALVTKDYLSKSRNVLVQAFANDTLGYMTMANQHDPTATHGLGLAHNAAGTGNYEEALSLGACTGEIVLNAMLEMGAELGVMGEGESP